MTDATLRKTDLWRYSVFAIPVAFAGFPLYVLAPDYYATAHGVSLSLLGFLLLGLRLFDAVQDPLIGALSDRYRYASIGFMAIASLLLCAALYGLFNALPPHPALWFSLCIAIAVTAYSVLSINLSALGGLWTNDPQEQTRIAAVREACGLMGLVLAVSLPSLLKQYMSERQAYFYFCLILFGVMILAWIAFYPWLVAHLTQHIGSEKKSYALRAALNSTSRATRYFLGVYALSMLASSIPAVLIIFFVRDLLGAALNSTSRATRYFLGVYALSMLASSIPAVLIIFFVRDLLGAEHMTGVFLMLYFLSGAASMPLWKRVSEKQGKYRAWMLGMLLAIGSFVWAFFLYAGDTWHYAMICLVSGSALGADLVLPPSILADHLHHSKNKEHAATYYALLALVAKLSLALASAIALPILSQAGFRPAAHNTKEVLFFLSGAYALIPCLLKLSAVALLWPISHITHKGVLHEKHHINGYSGNSHHA